MQGRDPPFSATPGKAFGFVVGSTFAAGLDGAAEFGEKHADGGRSLVAVEEHCKPAQVRWSGEIRRSDSGGLVRLETGLHAPAQRIDALEVSAPRPEWRLEESLRKDRRRETAYGPMRDSPEIPLRPHAGW